MKIAVLNSKGKETGREVTLPKEIFSIEPNEHALYLDVKQYLANQRQGTHKAKERADITGSTRKIKPSNHRKPLSQWIFGNYWDVPVLLGNRSWNKFGP